MKVVIVLLQISCLLHGLTQAEDNGKKMPSALAPLSLSARLLAMLEANGYMVLITIVLGLAMPLLASQFVADVPLHAAAQPVRSESIRSEPREPTRTVISQKTSGAVDEVAKDKIKTTQSPHETSGYDDSLTQSQRARTVFSSEAFQSKQGTVQSDQYDAKSRADRGYDYGRGHVPRMQYATRTTNKVSEVTCHSDKAVPWNMSKAEQYQGHADTKAAEGLNETAAFYYGKAAESYEAGGAMHMVQHCLDRIGLLHACKAGDKGDDLPDTVSKSNAGKSQVNRADLIRDATSSEPRVTETILQVNHSNREPWNGTHPGKEFSMGSHLHDHCFIVSVFAILFVML